MEADMAIGGAASAAYGVAAPDLERLNIVLRIGRNCSDIFLSVQASTGPGMDGRAMRSDRLPI